MLADGAVDGVATQALRTRLNGHRPRRASFDFGAARGAWEHSHGLAAERIAAWLPSLPAGVRRHAQTEIYGRLHATGTGPYASDAVTTALDEIADALGQTVANLQQAAE